MFYIVIDVRELSVEKSTRASSTLRVDSSGLVLRLLLGIPMLNTLPYNTIRYILSFLKHIRII